MKTKVRKHKCSVLKISDASIEHSHYQQREKKFKRRSLFFMRTLPDAFKRFSLEGFFIPGRPPSLGRFFPVLISPDAKRIKSS